LKKRKGGGGRKGGGSSIQGEKASSGRGIQKRGIYEREGLTTRVCWELDEKKSTIPRGKGGEETVGMKGFGNHSCRPYHIINGGEKIWGIHGKVSENWKGGGEAKRGHSGGK